VSPSLRISGLCRPATSGLRLQEISGLCRPTASGLCLLRWRGILIIKAESILAHQPTWIWKREPRQNTATTGRRPRSLLRGPRRPNRSTCSAAGGEGVARAAVNPPPLPLPQAGYSPLTACEGFNYCVIILEGNPGTHPTTFLHFFSSTSGC
jgi:hypothetical protein